MTLTPVTKPAGATTLDQSAGTPLHSKITDRGGLAWLLTGRLAQMGANGATLLLLARCLDLRTYGLFVTVVGAQMLASRAILMGLDVGMLRLRTLPEWRHRPDEVMTAGLAVLLRVSAAAAALAAVATLGFVVAREGLGWVPGVVAAGAIGLALVDYGCGCRLAHLDYEAAARLTGGMPVARLGGTVLVLLLAPRQPTGVFIAYAGTTLLFGLWQAAGGACCGRTAVSMPARLERALLRQLVRFSLWKGAADGVMVLGTYQGTFLLMLLRQPAAAGLFGLGLTLSLGFVSLWHAFGDLLIARVMQIEKPGALRPYLIRTLGVAAGLALACVPIALAVGTAAVRLLRPELRGAVPLFYLLSGALLLLLVQTPLSTACYYLTRPQRVTGALALRVLLIGALGLALAPRWGAWGAAVAQMAGGMLAFLAHAGLLAGPLRAVREQV